MNRDPQSPAPAPVQWRHTAFLSFPENVFGLIGRPPKPSPKTGTVTYFIADVLFSPLGGDVRGQVFGKFHFGQRFLVPLIIIYILFLVCDRTNRGGHRPVARNGTSVVARCNRLGDRIARRLRVREFRSIRE